MMDEAGGIIQLLPGRLLDVSNAKELARLANDILPVSDVCLEVWNRCRQNWVAIKRRANLDFSTVMDQCGPLNLFDQANQT